MDDHLIEVRDLRKAFIVRQARSGKRKPFLAVDGVSFSVPEGASVALIGESGSGKTTVARLIAGLEVPSTGTVEVCGRVRAPGRVGSTERRQRARELQMVFQDPYASLNPRQRVLDALREVISFHFQLPKSERDFRAGELLEHVGLGAREGRAYPSELSGGQRQRVAVARALATEPRVLILDEAVAALDVSIQAQVLNLLADLRRDVRITYLFLSHDLAVVRQIADEVVVMRTGRVIESGSIEQILERPQHEYTRVLRDSVPTHGWRPRRIRAGALR